MVLHTLNALPANSAFTDCLRLAREGDTILLLGDGVYNAINGSSAASELRECPADILVLDTDARGTGVAGRIADFPLVDMDAFVALSEGYPRQLAWY